MINSLKKYIEWLDESVSRGRKIVLMSTVFVFLIITILIFLAAICGVKMNANITTLYVTFASLMVSIYAFYTGTAADKSSKLTEKATNIIDNKINSIGDN